MTHIKNYLKKLTWWFGGVQSDWKGWDMPMFEYTSQKTDLSYLKCDVDVRFL